MYIYYNTFPESVSTIPVKQSYFTVLEVEPVLSDEYHSIIYYIRNQTELVSVVRADDLDYITVLKLQTHASSRRQDPTQRWFAPMT